jgi:hypothetical protein
MLLFAYILSLGLSIQQSGTPNFIGMTKDEVVSTMQKTNPGFDLDEGAVNTTYKYLKFVDRYNEETWLIFLSDDDKCTHTKLISDYSNLKIRTDELNRKYKKAGELKWVFIEKGIVYTVEMKKDEWFFSVVTKKKK